MVNIISKNSSGIFPPTFKATLGLQVPRLGDFRLAVGRSCGNKFLYHIFLFIFLCTQHAYFHRRTAYTDK
jgi:hypothetical protein